jgi:hypothetical protein
LSGGRSSTDCFQLTMISSICSNIMLELGRVPLILHCSSGKLGGWMGLSHEDGVSSGELRNGMYGAQSCSWHQVLVLLLFKSSNV